ncbi:glycosyltransferase [Neobacillus drentensis]|jgi:poly-beta-1,6-N-acetyl-D-glucosamine synthase|uniref:glycosyltransferase family 2 protein n=1 Tax=Neobacillus drentensis TaxID=220684 RepID=UPI002FFE9858
MENISNVWMFIIFIICLIFPVYHMIHALLIIIKKPYYQKAKRVLSEKPISILVPCYNEESIIKTTILGIDRLNYKNYEYILINDGSNDHTFEIMEQLLDLEIQKSGANCNLEFSAVKGVYRSKRNPNVIVIDKFNGGKADALNAGISYSSNELIITLDADSILDEKALSIINCAFVDPNLIAAGGTVHVLQGRRFKHGSLIPTLNVKSIVKFQIAEYLRGFYIYKASLAKANALSIISGAFGVFKKDVLIKVGGYRKTIGEDIDITLKVQHYKNQRVGLKVAYIPEAICYTEVPETWKGLYNQRIRWQKAFIDCTVLYLKDFMSTLLKSPLSFFFMIDALFVGVICSFITVISFILLIFFSENAHYLFFFLTLYVVTNFLYNLVGVIISYYYRNSFGKRDFLNILMVNLFDLIAFRLFTLFCTLSGTIQYFVNKEGWNKVARTGRKYHIEQEGEFM